MRRPLLRVTLIILAMIPISLAVASGGTGRHAAPHAATDVRLTLPDMDRPATITATALAPRILRTPGYRGKRTVPRTRPPVPPKPIIIGHGQDPAVTVDAAGTSHIVWNEAADPSGSDITHYCRLPRGAKACDNPNGTPMPLPVAYSGDYSGPKILQIGDQLVVLTHRYPAVVTHPDGQTDDDTTYAWTSTDGGTTWSGPGIVGNLPMNSAALVGGATPRIATTTDAYTPGLMAQMIDPGTATRQQVLLADSASTLIYDGHVAPSGNGVVAAASGPVGPVLVRQVGDVATAADSGSWSSQQVPGDAPLLAGGPVGPMLVTRTSSRPTLWRVDGTGTPKRVAVLRSTAALPVALTQDDSGGLTVAWLSGAPSVMEVRRVTATGGGGPAYPVATGQIDSVASSAAFDGGGVLVYRRDPTGTSSGAIAVAPFGTLAPTRRAGAGSRAGTGIPGAFAGCKAVGFGSVAVTPQAGCLLQSTDPKTAGAYVSRSTVDLNGLTLIPDAGVSIVINPAKRTLDTSGRVTVALEGPGIGRIPLARVELHVRLSGANGSSLFSGVSLPRGASLKGFPVDADFDIRVRGTGVQIPLSLRLPPALDGVSGSATIRASRGVGASLDSFLLSARLIPLGPVSIRDLAIRYTAQGNRWSGGGMLDFVTGGLKLQTEFANGRFVSGNFAINLPPPGVMVFSQVWLTQVRGGVRVDPRFSATLGASLGIIYVPSTKLYAANVEGDLTMNVRADDLQFIADGRVIVSGLTVGTGRLQVDTSGYAALTAASSIDLTAAQISGSLGGFFDGRTRGWGISSEATVRALGVTISKVAVAASPSGLGACGTASPPLPPIPSLSKGLQPAHVQVGYHWGSGSADVSVGTSCSLDSYRAPAPAQAMERSLRRSHAIEPTDRVVTVTARRTVNALLTGADGATPDVDVIDPSGAVVAADSRSVLRFPAGPGRLLVVLAAPRTGTWILRPRPGSPAVAEMKVARELAPVRVTGRLVGRPTARRLTYRVQAPAGTLVEFRETWARGGRRIAAATARRSGTVRLPVDGRGGQRSVVAVPIRNGIPQQAITVARYRAPGAVRLAAPRGVIVTSTVVRWRAVRGATRYVVRADLTSGRRVAVVVPASRRSVRIPGATRKAAVRRVQVAALDARRRTGRTAVAIAKPVRRR